MVDKMTDRQKQDAHNARKVARRAAEKSGAVKKGDDKDVDHHDHAHDEDDGDDAHDDDDEDEDEE